MIFSNLNDSLVPRKAVSGGIFSWKGLNIIKAALGGLDSSSLSVQGIAGRGGDWSQLGLRVLGGLFPPQWFCDSMEILVPGHVGLSRGGADMF